MRMGLLAAAVGTAVICATGAQGRAAGDGTVQAKMMAKDADPDWEVVTVRPSDPDDKRDGIDVRGRHVMVWNRTVESMLRIAYGVQKSQMVGGPDWMRTDHFDVDGVPNVEGQPDLKQTAEHVEQAVDGAVRVGGAYRAARASRICDDSGKRRAEDGEECRSYRAVEGK
jgi:hypothetical protein